VVMTRPGYWLAKFSKLRVDLARGDPAPHKPLLLLVLCDLVETVSLSQGVLALSPEPAFRFYTYWCIVAGRRTQRPDVRLPFHHLSGDGMWSVLDEQGAPSPDRKMTKYAKLPSDLVSFLDDSANREKARHLLIARYFRPSEQIALYAMIGLPVPSRQEIEQNAAYKSPEEAQLAGREARFRIRVVSAYNFICALSAYRLTTITAGIFTNSETAEITTRAMESHYLRMPTGHSIKGYGRLRTTTELSLQWGILQKQGRTRIIYSQAVTEDDFISRKIKLFGPIQFTLLGTER